MMISFVLFLGKHHASKLPGFGIKTYSTNYYNVRSGDLIIRLGVATLNLSYADGLKRLKRGDNHDTT
jgi:hypothetical protein